MYTTRPLSADERTVVAQVLESLDCPETEPVTAFLDQLRVDTTSTPYWITFAPAPAPDMTPPDLRPALAVLADTGVAIDVLTETGERIGGIRLEAADGALTLMNHFLLTGEEPTVFPRPVQLLVHPWRTRPLTPDEQSVLWRIINALPGPERLPLLAQLAHVSAAAGSIATMTNLVTGPGAVPVDSGSPLDVGAHVVGPDGDHIGGIVIFLDAAGEGYLGSIDYYWYGDARPEVFPRPDQVHLRGRP
jgi:hypothetical protein